MKHLGEKLADLRIEQVRQTIENTVKHLYRYEDGRVGERFITVQLRTYKVVKETRFGYWIEDFCNWPKTKRWVSKDARKRFAYETKEKAWESFTIRKHRQLAHLEYYKKQVEAIIELLTEEPPEQPYISKPYALPSSVEWDW